MRLYLCLSAIGAVAAAGSVALASTDTRETVVQVAAVDGLPEGEGREITAQLCTQCHAIGMVTSARHSRPEWDEVISRMVDDQGLSASDEDLADVAEYLAEHFGKAEEVDAA